MHLVRNTELWINHMTDSDFKEAIGLLEYEGIRRSEAAIWFFIDDEEILPNPNRYLFECLTLVNFFLNILWAVKDCSVNAKLGFLRCENKGKIGYFSNAMLRFYSKASGEVSNTEFSLEEVSAAKGMMKIFSFAVRGQSSRDQFTAIHKDNSRLVLFLHHLEAARSAGDLARRIMHGCSAVETLLSTSPRELTHQLSERVALFTTSKSDERREVFLEMKTIYDIRSKVAHGSALKESQLRKLTNISSKFDSLLRTLFYKVITNIDLIKLFCEGSEKDIDDYFLNIFFPDKHDSPDNTLQ
jgi:hypothetical protein